MDDVVVTGGDQERWCDWVRGRTWRAGRELDYWIDAAIGLRYRTRDKQPARVSANPLTLLGELLVAYQIQVTFNYGRGGWCVRVGGESDDYAEQEYAHEHLAVALGVAAMLYFCPPDPWLADPGWSPLESAVPAR